MTRSPFRRCPLQSEQEMQPARPTQLYRQITSADGDAKDDDGPAEKAERHAVGKTTKAYARRTMQRVDPNIIIGRSGIRGSLLE
jgi:hypothetical protein